MGSHPINLLLRFALELCALAAAGAWAWSRFHGAAQWFGVVLVPALLMVVWGTFAVPGDPSRGGSPAVVVPGLVRLVLELSVFGFATWAMADSGHRTTAVVFGGLVLVHYAISWDRIAWLLSR